MRKEASDAEELAGRHPQRSRCAILDEEFVKWFDEKLAGAPEAYQGAAETIWAHLHTEQRSEPKP